MSKKQTMRLSLITAAVLVVLLCLVGVFALNVSSEGAHAAIVAEGYTVIVNNAEYTQQSGTLVFNYAGKSSTVIIDNADKLSVSYGSDPVDFTKTYYPAADGQATGAALLAAPAAAGEYLLVLETVPEGDNPAAPIAEIPFNINPRVLVADSWGGVFSEVYKSDSPTPIGTDYLWNLTTTGDDFLDGDEVEIAYRVKDGDYAVWPFNTACDAKTYKVEAYLDGDDAGNYRLVDYIDEMDSANNKYTYNNFNLMPANISFEFKLGVNTVSSDSKTYDGEAYDALTLPLTGVYTIDDGAVEATIASWSKYTNNLANDDTTDPDNYTAGYTSVIGAGLYKYPVVTLTGNKAGNYNLLQNPFELTIEKATITGEVTQDEWQYAENVGWNDKMHFEATDVVEGNTVATVLTWQSSYEDGGDTHWTDYLPAVSAKLYPGTYSCRVLVSGNDNYKETPIPFTLTISQAKVYCVLSSTAMTYNGTTQAPVATFHLFSTDGPSPDSYSYVNTAVASVTENDGGKNVGNYSVAFAMTTPDSTYYLPAAFSNESSGWNYSGLFTRGNATYAVGYRITPADLDGSVSVADFTYGESITVPTIANGGLSVSGWQTGDSNALISDGNIKIEYAPVGNTASYEAVDNEAWSIDAPTEYAEGGYYIRLQVTSLANYTELTVVDTFNIEQKTLTFKWSIGGTEMTNEDWLDYISDDENPKYGETGYIPFTNTFTYTGTKQTPTVTFTNIGDDTVTITGAQELLYVGTPSPFTSDEGACIVAGLHQYNLISVSNSNYKIPTGGSQALFYVIEKKALTVTANNKAITYGDAAANDGVSYSGFVAGEDENNAGLTGTLAYAYNYNQYDHVGTYTITPSGLESSNYAIGYSAGTLTVNKKPIEVVFVLNDGTSNVFTYSPTYDGKTYTISASAAGVNSETITFDSTAFQKNAGSTSLTITAGDYMADGESTYANYVLESNATSGTLTVGVRAITVNVSNNTSVYGSTLATPTVTVISDQKEVQGETPWGTTSDFNALTSLTPVASSNVTIFENKSDNYNITFAAGNTYSITAKNLDNASVAQNGTLTYTGAALTANVTIEDYSTVGSNAISYAYSKTESDYGAMPTFTDAGEYTVYFEATAANHNAQHGSFTVTIAKRGVVVTLSEPASYVYSASAKAITGTYKTWADGAETNVTAPATLTLMGGDDNVNVGTFQYIISIADDNYTVAEGAGYAYDNDSAKWLATRTITAKTLVITFSTEAVYNGLNRRPAVQKENEEWLVEGLQFEDAWETDINVNWTDGYTINAGTHIGDGALNFEFTGTKAGNYTHATFKQDFEITPRPLTVNWGLDNIVSFSGASVEYNGQEHTVVAVVADGLVGGDADVTLNISGDTTATNANNNSTYTVTLTTGAYKATGSENYNYTIPADLENKTFTWTIYKKNVTISGIVAQDKVYDGTNTATFSNTLELNYNYDGENLVPTISGTFADANASNTAITVNYTLGLEGSAADNYALSVSAGSTTAYIAPKNIAGATITLADTNLVYSGQAQTKAVQSVVIDDLNATVDISGNIETNAGDYTLTVTGTENFTGTETAEWSIAKKAATITVNNSNRTYGQALSIDVTDSGILDADKALAYSTIVLAYDAENKSVSPVMDITTANVGTYYILVGTGSANYDFTINYVNGTSIDVKQTPEADPIATEVCTYTINNAAAGITNAPSGIANLVYTGAAIVLVTDGEATNGHFEYKVDDSAWVIAANAKATNAGTHTIVYRVVGDANYSNLEDDENYTFTVTIAKKALTIKAKDVTVTYGDEIANNQFDYTVTGLIEGDELTGTPVYNTYYYDGDAYDEDDSYEAGIEVNSSEDYTVHVSGLSAGNNYDVTFSTGVVYIVKREVSVTWAESYSYEYGGAFGENVVPTIGNRSEYDDEDDVYAVVSVQENENYPNVGTYTAVITGLAGDDPSNYKLPENGIEKEFTITAKSIAGAEITLADQTLVYNGSNQTRNVTSVVIDDLNATFDVSGNVQTNAGEHTITVFGTGNFTGSASKTWSIEKAPLTIKADNKNVEYGENAPAFTYSFDGFVNNETSVVLENVASISLSCSYVAQPTPGTYTAAGTTCDINVAGSVTADNYAISYEKGTLTVDKRGLTLNINHVEVEYGKNARSYCGYTVAEGGIIDGADVLDNDNVYYYIDSFDEYELFDNAVGASSSISFDYNSAPTVVNNNYRIDTVNNGTWTIVKKNVSSGITIEVGELTYNGAVQTIGITVKYGDVVMVEGTDYTVEDNSATAAGNYELCIHGIGNYTGNKTAEWSIAPKPITVVNVNEEHLEVVYGDAETLQATNPAAYVGLKDGFALAEGDTLAEIIAVSVDVNDNPVQSLEDVWNVNKYYLHVYDEFDEIKFDSNYTVTVELDGEAYLEIVKRPITIAYTKNEKVQIVFDPGAYIEYELASLVMENYSLFELIEGSLAYGDNDLSGVITIYSEEFEAFIETIQADFSNYFKVLGTYAIDVKDEQGNYEITLVEDANCAFEIVERPLYVVPADGQGKIYGEVDGEIVYIDLLTDNWTYDNEKQEWVCKRETIFKGNAPVAPVAPEGEEIVDVPDPEDYENDEEGYQAAMEAFSAWEDYREAVELYEQQLAIYEAEIAEYRALIFGLLEGNLGRVEGENAGAYAITIGNLHFKALPAEPVAQPVYDEYVANLPEEPEEPEEPAEPAELEAYAQAYAEWLEQYDAAMAEYNAAVAAYQEYGTLVGYKAFYELRIDEAAKYFTIGAKAITITAANKTSVYGDAIATLTATDTGIVAGDEASDVYTLAKAAGNNVGTYAITVVPANNANYVVTGVPAVYTITAKAITVTAENKQSAYGDAIATLTATADLVGDDVASEVYTLTKAAGNNVGTYAITVNVANNANYVVTAVNGTYTIVKKAITFSLYVDGVAVNGTDAIKVYDGQQHTFVIKALGAGNEIITLSTEDLTTVASVTASFEPGDFAADGAQVENYVLAQGATFNYGISAKPIDAIVYKIDGVVKNSVEYDGQNHGVIAYATDVEGNLFEIGGGPGKEAGSYTVTVEAGSYNDNYVLAETATFAWSITEKAAVVDPETGAKDYAKEISDKDAASDTGVNVTDLFKKADSEKTDDVESEVTITIKSGEGEEAKTGTIVFDKAAIAQLAGAADVALKVNVTSDVEEIAEIVAVKETLKGAEMVINVSLGNATFESGKATLTFDFDKQAPKGMIGKVYYVDADGNRTDMKATFANGKVTFETTHFSDYIVVFEKAPGLSGGAIAGIVIACVVVAAGIAVGIFFLLKKKKGNGGSATTAGEAAATETAAE